MLIWTRLTGQCEIIIQMLLFKLPLLLGSLTEFIQIQNKPKPYPATLNLAVFTTSVPILWLNKAQI